MTRLPLATMRNYLRVRGEYGRGMGGLARERELPPRARRIPHFGGRHEILPGTTSACAENTPAHVNAAQVYRNYLRVRGEYHTQTIALTSPLELPPRARRIHPVRMPVAHDRRTTSACAENTCALRRGVRSRGNYLRVRGEYAMPAMVDSTRMELPPRARRIPWLAKRPMYVLGTTSACAENTHQTLAKAPGRWNYLRVRGEYCANPPSKHQDAELPPRARRIP